MPGHDYTFGCQNEWGEFDVFAKVRDEPLPENANIILLSTAREVAERILDMMVERGLLVECEPEDGQRMYELTEKGEQLGQEAKENRLEGWANG